jgi:hypothetical protein
LFHGKESPVKKIEESKNDKVKKAEEKPTKVD